MMHAVLPNRIRFGMFPGFSRMIFKRPGEIFYIGGTDVLPAPLDALHLAHFLNNPRKHWGPPRFRSENLPRAG